MTHCPGVDGGVCTTLGGCLLLVCTLAESLSLPSTIVTHISLFYSDTRLLSELLVGFKFVTCGWWIYNGRENRNKKKKENTRMWGLLWLDLESSVDCVKAYFY